jgi:hypothetical protein
MTLFPVGMGACIVIMQGRCNLDCRTIYKIIVA